MVRIRNVFNRPFLYYIKANTPKPIGIELARGIAGKHGLVLRRDPYWGWSIPVMTTKGGKKTTQTVDLHFGWDDNVHLIRGVIVYKAELVWKSSSTDETDESYRIGKEIEKAFNRAHFRKRKVKLPPIRISFMEVGDTLLREVQLVEDERAFTKVRILWTCLFPKKAIRSQLDSHQHH